MDEGERYESERKTEIEEEEGRKRMIVEGERQKRKNGMIGQEEI